MNRSLLLALATLLVLPAGKAAAQSERAMRPTDRATSLPSPRRATTADQAGVGASAFPASSEAGGAFRLRAGVLGGGATDASSPSFRLRGTVAAEPVGAASSAGFQVGAGFWYQTGAPVALPPVVVTAAPLNPPVVISPGGGTFSFQVTLTNTTSQSQSFQGWTDALLPSGSPFGPALGPMNVTIGPNGTIGPLTFRQSVPGAAPSGTYAYRVRLGTFPDPVFSEATFPFEKTVSGQVAQASRVRAARTPRQSRDGGNSSRDGGNTVAAASLAAGEPVQRWAVEQVGGPPLERWSPDAAARSREGQERTTDAATAHASSSFGLPEAFSLLPAQPNPALGTTLIRYDVPAPTRVRLAVYDALGREVAVLADGAAAAGRHAVAFDPGALPSGFYLVRMTTSSAFAQTRRLTLLR